jgi:hypothetical protein
MRAWPTGLVAVFVGIFAWEVVPLIHPAREAWDVKEYWLAAYPAMILMSGLMGYVVPKMPWRWGITVAIGQGLWVLFRTTLRSGMPNLWPISLGFFAFLALPCVGASLVGAWLRRRRGQAV